MSRSQLLPPSCSCSSFFVISAPQEVQVKFAGFPRHVRSLCRFLEEQENYSSFASFAPQERSFCTLIQEQENYSSFASFAAGTEPLPVGGAGERNVLRRLMLSGSFEDVAGEERLLLKICVAAANTRLCRLAYPLRLQLDGRTLGSSRAGRLLDDEVHTEVALHTETAEGKQFFEAAHAR